MRIAFLHLSDIHFEAKDKEYNGRVDKIVNALRTLGSFSELFIIVSGDIAYSGDINQYKTAKKFFGRLGDLCKKTYNLAQFPRFLFVPGNHDVQLSSDPAFLSKVQKAYKENNVESLYAGEMAKQDNFFDFVKEFDCPFTAENSVLRKLYQLEGLSVEFVLINSAAFSMFEQEKGLHYLPENDLENACLASKADFVFYVMHHSYHWFNDEHKSRLEDEILRNANVLFVGHEHHPGNQGITHNENGKTIVLAGGMLANRGDWFSSDFAAYTLDTDATEMNWSGYSFHWKKRSKLYVESRGNNAMIESRKTIDSEIPPIKPDFLSNLMHDDKLTEDFCLDQYFVFPRLEKRDSDYAAPEECSTMNDFLRLLDKERKIAISGPSNSGKTTLLRSVIKQLMDTKMVVYCCSNDVTSGNRNRIIKNIVSEMYGDDQDQYTAFLQLPKEKKVLLIDDSNLINERNRTSFLADLGSEFGYVIIMRNEFLNLDIQEQIRIDAIGDYARYSLSPFYVDKRKVLIHKLVPLFVGNGENCEEIAETICDALRHQRITTYFTPDLVFQLTMYFCKNMAEATRNDGSIFDKVFEANLIKQIEPHIKKGAITIGKLLVILDKIAYHIHVHKLYPIPESEIIKVIEDYKSEYGSNVSIQQVLQTITESNVIRQDPQANAYYFTNKSTLVYFVAREIRRKYSETRDETDLRNVLTYCCFGINADILMMLTYITEDAGMLNILLNMALDCVEGWKEVSIDQKNIPLLSAGSSPTVAVLEDNVAQKQSEQELAREKKATQLSAKNAFGIYSYEEKDVDLLANQLSRAISLMVVVSRCLPSFEHLMRAPAKKQFVSAIYELPQKIFYRWASEIELIKEELVEQLYDMYTEAKKNNEKIKVPAKDQLAERIQAEALCQYLNILYIPVLYSTRPHTVEYLNDYDYSRSSSYGILHGMILERSGKIDELTSEMEKLFEKTDNVVVRYLIRKIMQHSIVFSKRISQAQVQRIEEKFLDGGKGHQKRLVARKSKQ